jgi:hypothetical protein
VHCESRVAVAVARGQFGNPEWEHLMFEAGTRGLLKLLQTKKTQYVCSELQTVRISERTRQRIVIKNCKSPVSPISN